MPDFVSTRLRTRPSVMEAIMIEQGHKRRLAGAAALILAGGLGFAIARWTAPQPPAVPQPEAVGPAILKLDPKEIAAAGILTEPVTAGAVGAEILAPAAATAQPNGVAALMAHAEGVISRLNKRLGDPVKAGEVLATVDSKDAAQLASDRASADARAVLARNIAAQEEALYRQGATSKRSLETAQASLAAAQADARRARNAAATANLASDGHSIAVISPLTGRITAQTAQLGAFVRTETELFRVSDPRLIQVEAQLTARDAARVQPGDAATLLLPNGSTARVSVRSVAPALDPLTRTQSVVLTVPSNLERGSALAPGETLQVRIRPSAASGSATAIAVPEEAVQTIDGHDSVFVQTDSGFAVRHVAVGSRSAGQAAIVSGLQAGERIATRNAFLLKAELGKGAEDEE
jgi:cobalt-zinc-cadmium efflux system membrane fusion protein